MTWPKLRLTKEEAKYCSHYYEHSSGKQPVKRRMYSNAFSVTPGTLQTMFPFQIARRCKLFAVTATGDIELFNVLMQTATGELLTTGPTHAPLLFGGPCRHPLSQGIVFAQFVPPASTGPDIAASPNYPFVIDPAFTLKSNETLNVTCSFAGIPSQLLGLPANPAMVLTFHLWEYPGMGDSAEGVDEP